MANIDKLTMHGQVTLVVRRPDGSIRDMRISQSNMKIIGTMNIIASAICNDPATNAGTCNKLALGTGDGVVSTDTALTGEIGAGCLSRTLGRYSHDSGSAMWNLSWSITAWSYSDSIGQAGIFTSITGGSLYLKATFAHVIVNSQDTLSVAWLQSLASA